MSTETIPQKFFERLADVFQSPAAVGLMLAFITLALVIFGPASGSRFIYTDF